MIYGKSPYCRDTPARRILTKFETVAEPAGLVTCAEFDVNPLWGLYFVGGQSLLLAIGRQYSIAATTVLQVII